MDFLPSQAHFKAGHFFVCGTNCVLFICQNDCVVMGHCVHPFLPCC